MNDETSNESAEATRSKFAAAFAAHLEKLTEYRFAYFQTHMACDLLSNESDAWHLPHEENSVNITALKMKNDWDALKLSHDALLQDVIPAEIRRVRTATLTTGTAGSAT